MVQGDDMECSERDRQDNQVKRISEDELFEIADLSPAKYETAANAIRIKFEQDLEKLQQLSVDQVAGATERIYQNFNFDTSTPSRSINNPYLFSINQDVMQGFAKQMNGPPNGPYWKDIQEIMSEAEVAKVKNPYQEEIQALVSQTTVGLANNLHWDEMQQLALQTVVDSANNPHWGEMQQLALQTVVDSANNPHWGEMQQLALQAVVDSAKNPYREEMAAEARNALFGHPDQSSEKTGDAADGWGALPDDRQVGLQIPNLLWQTLSNFNNDGDIPVGVMNSGATGIDDPAVPCFFQGNYGSN